MTRLIKTQFDKWLEEFLFWIFKRKKYFNVRDIIKAKVFQIQIR